MAHLPKPEDEDFVEAPGGHLPPPLYQHVASTVGGNHSQDIPLRICQSMERMETKMAIQDIKMAGMSIKLDHIKFNMAKKFLLDLVRTKEFARSVAACMRSDGTVDRTKFEKMIESAEPGGIAALVRKLMDENGLSDEDLGEILQETLVQTETRERYREYREYRPNSPGPEVKSGKWSRKKKIFVIGGGIGAVLCALLGILFPLLFIAAAFCAGACLAGLFMD